MPKLDRNALLTAHPRPYSLVLGFPDYRPKMVEHQTGKVVPSPNRTVNTLVKNVLTVDYAVVSGAGGRGQNVLISDLAQANALAKALGAVANPPPAPHPYASQASVTIDLRAHVAMAKRLKIM